MNNHLNKSSDDHILKKTDHLIKAIRFILSEITELDENISRSQGSANPNGVYFKVSKELFIAWQCPKEFKKPEKFITRLKYKGQLEPEFNNKHLIEMLNQFLKFLTENFSGDWMDYYSEILYRINLFKELNDENS